MTHLRKLMLEELQLRNYAQNTIRHYLRAVEDFARHFNCSPDRLGPRQIREYQAELFQKRKLSANSVGQHLAALRFFYIKTLRKAWSLADTPYPRKTRHLPTILSREEVAQLLHAARTPGERILARDPLRQRRPERRTDPLASQLRHRQSAHGGAHPWWQGPQRSRCHVSPESYWWHSAPTGVTTIGNPVPGCFPATIARVGRSIRKNCLVRMSESRPARYSPETRVSPFASPPFCDASRGWRGSPRHSGPARS